MLDKHNLSYFFMKYGLGALFIIFFAVKSSWSHLREVHCYQHTLSKRRLSLAVNERVSTHRRLG